MNRIFRKEGVGSAGDRLEKFGRPAVGAGGGGGAGAGGSDEVVTPLSERKPIKHHCKYCAQPFIRSVELIEICNCSRRMVKRFYFLDYLKFPVSSPSHF